MSNVEVSSGGLILWVLLFGVIGYLIAGGIGAAVGVAACLLTGVAAFLGFIPFGGPIIYWFVAMDIKSWVLGFAPTHPVLGLLVMASVVIDLIFSIIFCCISSFFVLALVFE